MELQKKRTLPQFALALDQKGSRLSVVWGTQAKDCGCFISPFLAPIADVQYEILLRGMTGLQVTIPQADPLFQLKRRLLQRHNLATQQTFQLLRHQVCRPLSLHCSD